MKNRPLSVKGTQVVAAKDLTEHMLTGSGSKLNVIIERGRAGIVTSSDKFVTFVKFEEDSHEWALLGSQFAVVPTFSGDSALQNTVDYALAHPSEWGWRFGLKEVHASRNLRSLIAHAAHNYVAQIEVKTTPELRLVGADAALRVRFNSGVTYVHLFADQTVLRDFLNKARWTAGSFVWWNGEPFVAGEIPANFTGE